MVKLSCSMLQLRLHDSLWNGLCEEAGLGSVAGLGPLQQDKLEKWADEHPSPAGQKAALARCIARLIYVTGHLEVSRDAANRGGAATFWEAVARL